MTIEYSITPENLKRINDFFTKKYNFKHWFYKIKIYEKILANPDVFIEQFGDGELRGENIESFKLNLKSEIFFNFFHISEALFSLMASCLNSKIPWLMMSSIRFEELCTYVRDEIISEKISDEHIRYIFYNGIVGETSKDPRVVGSIKFIKQFLKKSGELFLENDIYNGYKHGLRVMTDYSQFRLSDSAIDLKEKNLLKRAGDTNTYLKSECIKKDGKDEQHKLKIITKSFDYELYLRLCIYTFRMISILFSSRRQKETLKDGDLMQTTFFDTENIEQIFKEDLTRKFSFTIGDV